MFSFWSTIRLTKLIQFYKHLSIFIVSTKYHIDLMKWLRCCKIDFLAGSTFLQNFSKRLWIFFSWDVKKTCPSDLYKVASFHYENISVPPFSRLFKIYVIFKEKSILLMSFIFFCFLRKPHNILRNFRHLQQMLFLYIIHHYKYVTVLHEKSQMVFYNKEVT